MLRRLALALGALACLAAVVAAEMKKVPKEANIPRPLEDGDVTGVPDPNNEKDAASLKCHVCHGVNQQLHKAFTKVRKEFDRQPKKLREYHLLAAAGDVCEASKLHMGLMRHTSTKMVGPEFVHENDPHQDSSGVVKGSWVTSMWTQGCFEVIDRVEDDLRKIYDGKEYYLCPECEGIAGTTINAPTAPAAEKEAAAAEEKKAEL